MLVYSKVDEARLHWGPLMRGRFDDLGTTATILALGAERRTAAALTSTTFTTSRISASGQAVTATLRQASSATALSAWATPLDLTLSSNWRGHIPIVRFTAASSENISIADNAYWTTAATNKFSLDAWLSFSTISAQTIWSKYTAVTGAEDREWRCGITAGGLLFFEVWDETANAVISRTYSGALVVGPWYHINFVYDGGTADGSCLIYLNGTQVDDTNAGSGVFTTMRDGAQAVRFAEDINTAGTHANLFNGWMAGGPLGPAFTQVQLTAAQILNMHYDGMEALGL